MRLVPGQVACTAASITLRAAGRSTLVDLREGNGHETAASEAAEPAPAGGDLPIVCRLKLGQREVRVFCLGLLQAQHIHRRCCLPIQQVR